MAFLTPQTLYFRSLYRAARREGRIPTYEGFREYVVRLYRTALVSLPSERCAWEREIVSYARSHSFPL